MNTFFVIITGEGTAGKFVVAVQKYRWHLLNSRCYRIFLKNNIGKVSSRSKQNSSIVCLF